jgi:hypothetical protein
MEEFQTIIIVENFRHFIIVGQMQMKGHIIWEKWVKQKAYSIYFQNYRLTK